MKEALQSLAFGRKTDRCLPFRKAADLRRANRSCRAESFPTHSQFLAKLLTGAPVNFYLRTAEVGIEILDRLRRFICLVARDLRRFELHCDVCITAVAQLVCKEPEQNQKVPVRQCVTEEKQRASERTVHAVRE